MCTAIIYHTGDHYFGRTLDLEYSYKEAVTVTPRKFPLEFYIKGSLDNHYAIIGMATQMEEYPLYYDAANEHGLAMAALNFPGNAHYFPLKEGKDNIAPFELIPWILGQCRNLQEARTLLEKINICNIAYDDELPNSPLHWMLADRNGALTVESVADGLKIYENPVGVLTNNPPFDYHMNHLSEFLNLTSQEPEDRFGIPQITPYSRGMGAIGLPGDLSSASRFVRAAFVKGNAVSDPEEEASISQFFHILGAVEQQRGCVRLGDGNNVITVYTSCINVRKGIYYYTTYENRCISAVDMHQCNLEANALVQYPLIKKQMIHHQN